MCVAWSFSLQLIFLFWSLVVRVRSKILFVLFRIFFCLVIDNKILTRHARDRGSLPSRPPWGHAVFQTLQVGANSSNIWESEDKISYKFLKFQAHDINERFFVDLPEQRTQTEVWETFELLGGTEVERSVGVGTAEHGALETSLSHICKFSPWTFPKWCNLVYLLNFDNKPFLTNNSCTCKCSFFVLFWSVQEEDILVDKYITTLYQGNDAEIATLKKVKFLEPVTYEERLSHLKSTDKWEWWNCCCVLTSPSLCAIVF